MQIPNLKHLLSDGYIPEELPKAFSSRDFSNCYDNYKSLLTRQNASIPYKFDIYKKKYATRQFSVLNPYNFAFLTKQLHDHWAHIQHTLDSSRLSLTRITFNDEPGRAIKQIGRNQFQDLVFSRSTGMNVFLKTDITEHYDATYTHGIAWALHGKEYVKDLWKRRDPLFKELPGNKLDKAVSACDELQTNGIPTGPETSRIISEFILSAIDKEFNDALLQNNIKFVGGRYVDDYEFYFESTEKAKIALQILRDTLSRYKYKINEAKTYILSGPPIPTSEEWKRRLFQIVPQLLSIDVDPYSIGEDKLPFKDIKNFIKEVVALSRELDNPKIIDYILKVYLRKFRCNDESWSIYEVYLLQLLANYPNVTKVIIDIIQNHEKGDSDAVSSTLNSLLSKRSLSNYDAIWLMYGCLVFELPLSTNAQNNIVRINDPLLWLILAHMNTLNRSNVDPLLIEAAWAKYSLQDEGWLFKYEAVHKGWIVDDGTITGDPFFNKLHTEGVSFYLTNQSDIELDTVDWALSYEELDVPEKPTSSAKLDWLFLYEG